ncbi:hypothetical protein K458DRAFT_415739 [Lentithecium fluviatile CBS 122367]|uniref:polynucleotide adenylyltransferase n=1 Tax=Lentithecium fluviatile CBS 122367 TaxID=1168545 RepID=A0A6G1JBK0_9PLEO|nr:hypothetical protein K458DRAFT_415739 [Lentithecium fluviatile CBS 122367]
MSTSPAAPDKDGKPEEQKASSLEDGLRKMILGNVTISNEESHQAAAQSSQRPHSRGKGRGRGRGGFFRGRGDGHFHPHVGRGQFPDPFMAAPTARGGMRGSPHHRFNRQGAPSSPPANGFQGEQTLPDKRRASRAPSQTFPPSETETTVTLAAQPPRILHRPHGHTTAYPSNAPHHASHGQYPQPPYGSQHFNRLMIDPIAQVNYLDQLALFEIPKVEITLPELEEKETFRKYLEELCQKALSENSTSDIATISLVGFGSLASGFATPGSDMDLALVPDWKDPSKGHEIRVDRGIPRLLEKALLDANMGARLLTRTRVPILKVCQNPNEELYQALSGERQKWDALPGEEKYAPTPPPPERSPRTPADVDGGKRSQLEGDLASFPTIDEASTKKSSQQTKSGSPTPDSASTVSSPTTPSAKDIEGKDNMKKNDDGKPKDQHQRKERPWFREKARGPLDFPKTGVGIQCDINFENPLGIHNTQLLRCYSYSDPRVRPIVLFVKAWAKRRKINSAYSGTLSSYGWVLMVLHYLVNIAQPPVCPNLQSRWRPPTISTDMQGLEDMFKATKIGGYVVRFWRNEQEILHAAQSGQLTRNQETVGALLRGFFQYYALNNPGFDWMRQIVSLRTPGGIMWKLEKGWTAATSTISNGKEVRNRYLFAIEDPFEIDHNVARTVTHPGVVAIRDEFRRAWRILSAVGRGQRPEGGIFDEIVEQAPPLTPTKIDAETEAGAEEKPLTMTMEHVAVDGGAEGLVGGQSGDSKESAPTKTTM